MRDTAGSAAAPAARCRKRLRGSFIMNPPCGSLFDHLVGAGDERRRNFEAERPGSLQVDDELELGGLQNGEVRRFLSLKDAPRIDADLAVPLRIARSVAHQSAGFGKLAECIDRGYPVTDRQRGQLYATVGEKHVGADQKRIGPLL